MTCHELGPVHIKALGIPPNCTSFELRCAVGEIVAVRCEFAPTGNPDEIGAALVEYELHAKPSQSQPEKHPADVMGFDAWMRERTEAAHAAFMRQIRMLP